MTINRRSRSSPSKTGKTEAYLGLAAFTMFLRRLRNPGSLRGCGVAVIMRYTLRLLTLDQLGRGAALIYDVSVYHTQISEVADLASALPNSGLQSGSLNAERLNKLLLKGPSWRTKSASA